MHERLSHSDVRTFTCRRCGQVATGEVAGYGRGDEARRDLERSWLLARCPSCKRRRRGAVLRWSGSFVVVVAMVVAFGAVVSTLLDELWLTWIWVGTTLFLLPFFIRARWHNLGDRVIWMR